MAKQPWINPDKLPATGWDNGMCQDCNRGLALWFSTRLGAGLQLKRVPKTAATLHKELVQVPQQVKCGIGQ